MNEETLKIAKKIEKLKREFSMLPPLTERYSNLEVEEYQHYLLELEELIIVFKYLSQRKPAQNQTLVEPIRDEPLVPEVEDINTENEPQIEGEVIDIQDEKEEAEGEDKVELESGVDEVLDQDLVEPELIQEPEELDLVEINEQDVEDNLDSEEIEKNAIEEPKKEMIATGSSVNDQIDSSDNTVASKLARQPIGDLRNAFGLNERFLFSNELFGGDGQEFMRALNELNHLDSFEDAKRMLEARYENNFGWDKDSESVIAFVEVIERRYL